MDALFQASPNSQVLVASIFNLESIRSAVLADNPTATFTLCNNTFFGASDVTRALVMNRLQQFNSVLSTGCATYANCKYDGGALFAHQWTRAEVSTVDNLHPSVVGQNMISTTLWNVGFWPDGSSTSPVFQIATSSLPPATRGTPYGPVTLQAVNLDSSTSPYTTTLKWGKVPSATGGKILLPRGTEARASSGVLSGTPSTKLPAGATSITVQAAEKVVTFNGKQKVVTKKTVQASIPLVIN